MSFGDVAYTAQATSIYTYIAVEDGSSPWTLKTSSSLPESAVAFLAAGQTCTIDAAIQPWLFGEPLALLSRRLACVYRSAAGLYRNSRIEKERHDGRGLCRSQENTLKGRSNKCVSVSLVCDSSIANIFSWSRSTIKTYMGCPPNGERRSTLCLIPCLDHLFHRHATVYIISCCNRNVFSQTLQTVVLFCSFSKSSLYTHRTIQNVATNSIFHMAKTYWIRIDILGYFRVPINHG